MATKRYYVELGGGLGDIFQQIYGNRTYGALKALSGDERATVALITHNPFAHELFAEHPMRRQLQVRSVGYWLPQDDTANRRRCALPPFDGVSYAPGPVPVDGPLEYYPTRCDAELIRGALDAAAHAGKPVVVFSVSAGEPHRSFPRDLVQRIVPGVVAAGCVPVFVGRTYQRNSREELRGPWLDNAVDLIDRLTVPGTAVLVQRSDGVVCAHSSINMLAWMERKPQLLLYPKAVFEELIYPRTQWAVGIDYPETVHATFEAFDESLIEKYLLRVRLVTGGPARDGVVGNSLDIRDILRQLPFTCHPETGEDYTATDWFRAWNGYPFYVRAAEVIQPTSILEIGSLLGFGMASFIHGSRALCRITAVDNETSIANSQAGCAQNLAFFQGDQRFVRSLEAARGAYDMIHVDAASSFEGALHHIAYAWGLGPRVMLVDDYDFLAEVRRAVHAFADHHALPFKHWRSYRGWAVFATSDTLAALPDQL